MQEAARRDEGGCRSELRRRGRKEAFRVEEAREGGGYRNSIGVCAGKLASVPWTAGLGPGGAGLVWPERHVSLVAG